MATRIFIGIRDIENSSGYAIEYIYCRFGGGVDTVGESLITNYNTIDKARELIEGGCIFNFDDKKSDIQRQDDGCDETWPTRTKTNKGTKTVKNLYINDNVPCYIDYIFIYDASSEEWAMQLGNRCYRVKYILNSKHISLFSDDHECDLDY